MKIYTKEMIKEKNARRKKINKIFKMIFTPLIILFLLFCIFIAYQKIILKSPNVEIFGHKMYVVLTGSMKPEINPNDIVIVKKVKQESLKKGDIITFLNDRQTTTVTHRIIELVEKDGIIMKKRL